jgi:pimeloyl-ACP methyl ester carboxylesterase
MIWDVMWVLTLFSLVLLLWSPGTVEPDGRQATQVPAVEGWWEGGIPVSGLVLRLELHITRNPDGSLAATMKSIDQGGAELPVVGVTQADRSVTVSVRGGTTGFSGMLSADAQKLEGTFTQGASRWPITFARATGPLVIAHTQDPRPPFPYREEEVSIDAGSGVRLAGTLTLPPGNGPFAAVILIGGSGPNDRNEDIVGHKVFRLLADTITRRGVAVLRMDKRGIGKSTGSFPAATTKDFAQDVGADIDYLATRSDIDARRIGLVGHSEGGMIAPIVAGERPAVAFVVMLAGPGRRGDVVLAGQNRDLAAAQGAPPETLAAIEKNLPVIYAIVESTPDAAQASAKVQAAIAAGTLPANDYSTLLARLGSPWVREFLTLDPAAYLSKVKCPVLALIGSKDLQVSARENLPAIQAALAGNPDVQVREMAGLNHLFQTAKSGLPAEYAQIDETMSPAVLSLVGDWIVAHAAKKA